jgi:hypothetical protein
MTAPPRSNPGRPPPGWQPSAAAGAQYGHARRCRPSPGPRGSGTPAGAAGAVLPRTLAAGAGRCHPQHGMVGVGDGHLVASGRTRARSPAPASRAGDRIRRARAIDRRIRGRERARVDRTSARQRHRPAVAPAAFRRRPPPACRRRPGTPPLRPGPLTDVTRSMRGKREPPRGGGVAVPPPGPRPGSGSESEAEAVRFGVGGDQQRHRLDQRQVRECLREIPQVLARRGVDLLGVEHQRSGQ